MNTFNKNRYSLSTQIYILKKQEQDEITIALDKVSKIALEKFKEATKIKFNIKDDEYEEFNTKCGNLFNAGLVFKDSVFDEDKVFNYINESYSSSKIFSKEHPLIQNILEPYIPSDNDFSKSYITDFKVFYLFANYDDNLKGLNKLKCKNQFDLLENTLEFIEAIRK